MGDRDWTTSSKVKNKMMEVRPSGSWSRGLRWISMDGFKGSWCGDYYVQEWEENGLCDMYKMERVFHSTIIMFSSSIS
jgi:hypothetical protein